MEETDVSLLQGGEGRLTPALPLARSKTETGTAAKKESERESKTEKQTDGGADRWNTGTRNIILTRRRGR